MPQKSPNHLLLLQQFLYEQTDDSHTVSVSDILAYWRSYGINAGRKSVYSAIGSLQDSGLDIICVKSTQNRYIIGARLFELPELKLLVDAVESSHFITQKKSRQLIQKLGRLTSTAQAKALNRHIYMDGTVKPGNEAIYYNVDMLQTAIQSKQQVSFQYYEYTPNKEKVLKHKGYRYRFSPYALIWSRDFYYVVGWSEKHGKLAQFRVDRMVSMRTSKDPAVSSPDFNAAEYVRTVFNMYPEKTCAVQLLCDNDVMRNIIDRFGEGVYTEVIDRWHFRAVVQVSPSPPFFGWVFGFGGKIRITGPSHVLGKMKEMGSWLTS